MSFHNLAKVSIFFRKENNLSCLTSAPATFPRLIELLLHRWISVSELINRKVLGLVIGKT